VQARNRRLRQFEARETCAAFCIVGMRAERADVERRRDECLHQRQIIELRFVGECDHRAARIARQRARSVIRRARVEHRIGCLPLRGVLLARVADDHLIVERLRHLRDEARQLPGADQHQPPRGTKYLDEVLAVEAERNNTF